MSLAGVRRWLIPFFVLVLTAAACSGGDDDGGGGSGLGADRQEDDGGGDDGGDDEDSASDAERDGCEIVTADDAEEILQEPVTRFDEGTETPLVVAECVWQVDTEFSSKMLQFQVYDGKMFYGEDQFKEGGDINIVTVEGLGDRAFFYGDPATSLQVLDGDTMVALSASWFDLSNPETPLLEETTVQDQLKALAREVLSRL
ncbi:MAG TPA: hypothetical protein VI854_03895 [Acidimicrobiia bacterium]|nr:hypothetical protein [Acidimicrobiia bacterium]